MMMFGDEGRFDRPEEQEQQTIRVGGGGDGEGGGGTNNQPSPEDILTLQDAIEQLRNHLTNNINQDIATGDIKWSLFVSAAHCFRRDTCLRPYPTAFMNNNVDSPKDFDTLLDTISKVPNFQALLEILESPEPPLEYSKAIKLLHFVLVQSNEPRLEVVEQKEIDEILKKVPCEGDVCRPQRIFKLVASPESPSEQRFQAAASGKNTFYAYHGSKLENFYSIMHHGLQQHMNKNYIFGPGIYLSSELSVSLPYSPHGFGWGCSEIGSKLSCVALCELIDTPDGVLCRKTLKNRMISPTNAQTSKEAIGGPVPNKYYIVSNNDLVRVRYLMIYVNDKPSIRKQVSVQAQNRGFVANWIYNHKMMTMLIGYIILLASIGLANNKPVQYYCRLFMKKIESSIKNFAFPSLN